MCVVRIIAAFRQTPPGFQVVMKRPHTLEVLNKKILNSFDRVLFTKATSRRENIIIYKLCPVE